MLPPPSSLVSPRTAARTARALARCLLVTEQSAGTYARAARRVGESELGAWLSGVAAERAAFATTLRGFLAHLRTIAAPAELVPEPDAALADAQPSASLGPRELIAACDATDLEAQRVYEVCRSELARVDVPREIRTRIDAQYAAVCNARFDLDRIAAAPLAG